MFIHIMTLISKRIVVGTGEKAQQLRALTVLVEDTGSVPTTNMMVQNHP